MTKRSHIGLLIVAASALAIAGSAHALGFLEFEQAFGRKGSGGGGFSSEINLAFDADGSSEFSLCNFLVIASCFSRARNEQ